MGYLATGDLICHFKGHIAMFGFAKSSFSDEPSLVAKLRAGDSQAIIYLQDKANGFAANFLSKNKLPDHLLPDVLNEAAVIFIKKLREPGFSLHSAQPTTYFLEIVKYVALNKTRSSQAKRHESIEDQFHLADNSVEEYHARKARIELIDRLLGGVGVPCAVVIRLKYIEGFADEETVRERRTRYTTVESLRMKRSDCMKKLKEAAQKMPSEHL